MLKLDLEKMSDNPEVSYVLCDLRNEEHVTMLIELKKDYQFKEVDFLLEDVINFPKYSEEEKQKVSDDFTVIAQVNNYPVAILQLREETKKDELEVLTAVRPSERNKGIKKRMVLAMCEYLNSVGIKILSFNVHATNFENLKSLSGINVEKTNFSSEEEGYSKYIIYTDNIMYVNKLPLSRKK